MSHLQAAIRYAVLSQTLATTSLITDVNCFSDSGFQFSEVCWQWWHKTANQMMLGLVTWGARSTNCHLRW